MQATLLKTLGTGVLLAGVILFLDSGPSAFGLDLRTALIEDGLRKIDDTDRFSLAIADFTGHPDPFSNVNQQMICEAEAYSVAENASLFVGYLC